MAKRLKSLFPIEEENPIRPVSGRTEPMLWVRHLVILKRLHNESEIIREIPFRQGLNVVATADNRGESAEVISHSVGKTLLMRLIRYCLGESHFEKAEVIADVSREFEGAYVVAEIRLNGIGWVVMRPLKDGTATESYSIEAERWQDAITNTSRGRFSAFTNAVEAQTLNGLPEFRLPRSNRAPHWLDVLGWLSRDYECKYQQPDIWRHEDSNSGTLALDRTDAGLLMTWIVGLLDQRQIEEIANRRDLHRQLKEAKSSLTRFRRSLESQKPILTEALSLTEDELEGGALFGDAAATKLTDEQGKITALIKALSDDDKAGSLYDLQTDAIAAVKSTEAEIRNSRNWLELTAKEKDIKRPTPENPDAAFDPRRCPLWRDQERCKENQTDSGPLLNPNEAAELARLRLREENERKRLQELTVSLPQLQTQERKAKQAYKVAKDARDQESQQLERLNGQWTQIAKQFEQYKRTTTDRDKATKQIEKLEQVIELSRQKQQEARIRRTATLKNLSAIYEHTLRFMLGNDADGKIRLQARGLQPVPGKALAVNGDAMSFMGRVIAFDLACLASSLSGIGQLPGIWIHDSPNTVELQPALYAKLFRFAVELERLCQHDKPCFQYFVSTAGSVPADIAPFVVLELDRREAEKTLLKRYF